MIKREKSVLVIGANGFIGSKLVEKLYGNQRYKIIAGVHSWANAARAARFPVEIRLCDVLDKNSLKKFNREIFLGVPLSTKLKDNKYYVPISVGGKTVSAMTSQIRVFSSKKIWNKLAELDKGDFGRALEEVRKFFILPFPQKREGRG